MENDFSKNKFSELHTKSLRRYADFYDFAPVAFITTNDKGLILEANLTAGDMLGVTRGQLLNRLLSDFIFFDDQDTYYLRWRKLLETGRQQSYDLRLRRSDGTVFHSLVKTVAHSAGSDPPSQFRIVISDISIRKEAELAKLRRMRNRYRAIVMDQTEMICRFDPQGRITFVNDAYCRHFDVNHQDILGTNFLPAIHQDDLPLVEDHFKNLTQFKPDKTIEYRVYLPDGKVHWQQWCGRALYNEAGHIYEYQAVGRDISQLKEAEEKLKNAHHELEKQVAARTAELTHTVHELRNVLETLLMREKELQETNCELLDTNTALNIMLKRRDLEHDHIRREIAEKTVEMVLPLLKKAQNKVSGPAKDYMQTAQANLLDVFSTHPHDTLLANAKLAPRELQVVHYIRQGKTSKEIADLLNLSVRTIESYRENIRKKLRIKNQKKNLKKFVTSIR